MSDPRLYQGDHYVVLEPNQAEQFLTAPELLEKLLTVLAPRQQDLPLDLQRFPTLAEQVDYLLETSCEFEVAPGESLQWYVVRLNK